MKQSRGQKLLYLLVFIILIGFLGFAIASSNQPKKVSKTAKPAGISQSTAPDKTGTSSKSTQNPSQAAATANNSQLANTGPKETVAYFIVAVVGSTAVAHLYQRRRYLV